MDQYKIAELIFRELQDKLSEEERNILNHWIHQDPENKIVYEKIISEENIKKRMEEYDEIETEKFWKKFEARIEGKEKIRRLSIVRIMKYAAILIPVFITAYLFTQRGKLFVHKEPAQMVSIPPGTQKAILTTSDNEKIELGHTANKRIFDFGKTIVTDTSNTLTYTNSNKEESQSVPVVVFNSLETPRGGEYTIVLSDGTKVFLNAETRLTFPELFNGRTREVILEGEAYFEVTKRESQPFVVKTADMDVRVYGTSFNVSAYPSDNVTYATLVDGSVEVVIDETKAVRLEPGQQALYNRSTTEFNSREVETWLYTDWKNGLFSFKKEPLENILKKLSRWYDFEMVFASEDLKYRSFTGDLRRYDNISTILDMISIASDLEFKIEGKTIFITRSK